MPFLRVLNNNKKENLMKRNNFLTVLAFIFIFLSSVNASPDLPLSFNLSIHPDLNGSLMDAELLWQRASTASSLSISYLITSQVGDVPDGGTDSLYSLSTGDGEIVISPFILSGSLSVLEWSAGAGLGVRTELVEERGNYQSLGTQVFINTLKSWRLGLPLSGTVSAAFGPVRGKYSLTVNPFMFYRLSQTQESSLVAPVGELATSCLIGPEIIQRIRFSVYSLVWVSVYHEFLWLSVPALQINEAGDAWTSVIEGYSNQNLRLLLGASLTLPEAV